MFNIKNILLQNNPSDPTVILLRHADKMPIGADESDFTRELTENGLTKCTELAHWFKKQGIIINHIFTSPVIRTRQTAEIINKIFNKATLEHSTLLGHPGCYVNDSNLAAVHFDIHSITTIVNKLFNEHHLPGFNSIECGSMKLLNQIQADLSNLFGTILYVSHDVILATFISYFLNTPITNNNWIDFLDGFIIQKDHLDNLYIQLENQVISPMALPPRPVPFGCKTRGNTCNKLLNLNKADKYAH